MTAILPPATALARWVGLALPRWERPSWRLDGYAIDERMAERYAESLAADETAPPTLRLP
jgi:hypothetical protein